MLQRWLAPLRRLASLDDNLPGALPPVAAVLPVTAMMQAAMNPVVPKMLMMQMSNPTPMVTPMVRVPTATMMVVMPVPMTVGRADPGAKDLGVPLRGRAFRSNLRFAPISTAIPDASVR
ncbi:MAG: hypothetical protein OXF79_10850 [Chloroflexi bacterium]|nr:hypothetical protein [Chloroflexota bacterium]